MIGGVLRQTLLREKSGPASVDVGLHSGGPRDIRGKSQYSAFTTSRGLVKLGNVRLAAVPKESQHFLGKLRLSTRDCTFRKVA